MKRTITTALVLTLLTGTSALAQERQPWARGAGGSFQGGQSREAAAATQAERRAQPQAQPQPQSRPQPQARPQQQDDRQQARPQGQAPQDRQQPQRPQGAQPQVRPAQAQATPQARQDRPGGFVGRATADAAAQAAARAQAGPNRPGQQPGPNRDGRGDDRGRPGYNDGRGPGGYDRPGSPQGRPPVIRPEDRRDRDRGRPRYDQRTFPRYVTPLRRYQWRGPAWRPPVGYFSFRWQFGQTLPWNWYTPNYYLNDYWNYGLPRPPIGCEWVRVGDDAVLVDVFDGRIYQVVYNLFW